MLASGLDFKFSDIDDFSYYSMLFGYAMICIPNIIAFSRVHPSRWIIFLMTTLGSVFIVGWFVGLVWACSPIKSINQNEPK